MFGVSERLRHHIMFFYELRVLEIEQKNERQYMDSVQLQGTGPGVWCWPLALELPRKAGFSD
jgi:hypothetical protein